MRRALIVSLLKVVLSTCWTAGEAMATERQPAAIVDLGTEAGAELVHATWRYSDARIVDTSFRSPDAQGQPTGAFRATTFGLPKFFDDPRKELPSSGVLSWKDGRLRLAARELKGPNGIVFSPDEKDLYVSNWDPDAKTVTRYTVRRDGSLGPGVILIDLTRQIPGEEALDGMKAVVRGNLSLSAPGGVWIFDATGRHLGTITAPRPVHNFNWGGEDGRTLYLCARSALYRIDLLQPGIRP